MNRMSLFLQNMAVLLEKVLKELLAQSESFPLLLGVNLLGVSECSLIFRFLVDGY